MTSKTRSLCDEKAGVYVTCYFSRLSSAFPPLFGALKPERGATNLSFRPSLDPLRHNEDRTATTVQLLIKKRSIVLAIEAESESGPTLQLSFERVEKLPPESELRRLAEIHQLGFSEVQDWLALRNILSAYGWIASRVGDYSVPHTSLIFAVFKCSVPLAGVNALGLLGRPGMVPLRGSKLAEVWGSSWSSRFTFVNKATMAESLEDYGKLLQGVEDIKPVDEEAPIGVSKAQV